MELALSVSTMNLTGKQKRFLRAMGSGIDPIVQVGKMGVNENVITQIDEALEARELLKIKVLNNCPIDLKEVAEQVAVETDCAVAQTIGHIILVYRPSKEKPQIQLP